MDSAASQTLTVLRRKAVKSKSCGSEAFKLISWLNLALLICPMCCGKFCCRLKHEIIFSELQCVKVYGESPNSKVDQMFLLIFNHQTVSFFSKCIMKKLKKVEFDNCYHLKVLLKFICRCYPARQSTSQKNTLSFIFFYLHRQILTIEKIDKPNS